jgi:hypothetical protein
MEDSAFGYLNYVQAYLVVMSNLANSPRVTSIYMSSEQIYHRQGVKLSCIEDIHLRKSKGKSLVTSSIK